MALERAWNFDRMPVRILIADDHPLMRGALRQSVIQFLADGEIVEAASFEEVESALATSAGFDVMLLDLHMPGMDGLIGLTLLRNEHPAIPAIVVSAQEDPVTIQRTMEYGASGFVPKSAPIGRIGEAVQAVLDGAIWFPTADPTCSQEGADLAARVSGLTPQQLRVLAGIANGKLNKQIAHEMGVVETTVKAHVTIILRRLGVHSRTQAALIASRLKLSLADETPQA